MGLAGTVTFLFTNIEDSTTLAQQYPAELPALLAQQDAILRQVILAHDGRILRTVGDSYAAAFLTATQALKAALQAQRKLQKEDWHPNGA